MTEESKLEMNEFLSTSSGNNEVKLDDISPSIKNQ